MKSTAKLRYEQALESGNTARAEALAKKYPSVLAKPVEEKPTKSKKGK